MSPRRTRRLVPSSVLLTPVALLAFIVPVHADVLCKNTAPSWVAVEVRNACSSTEGQIAPSDQGIHGAAWESATAPFVGIYAGLSEDAPRPMGLVLAQPGDAVLPRTDGSSLGRYEATRPLVDLPESRTLYYASADCSGRAYVGSVAAASIRKSRLEVVRGTSAVAAFTYGSKLLALDITSQAGCDGVFGGKSVFVAPSGCCASFNGTISHGVPLDTFSGRVVLDYDASDPG